MTWTPTGIDLTERFRAYVEQLRATHEELAEDGVNVPSDDMTEDDTTDETVPTPTYRDAFLEAAHYARSPCTAGRSSITLDSQMSRRAFVASVGAAAAATATAGTAAAQEDQDLVPNFESKYTPQPRLKGTQLRVTEHDASEMGELDYVDNDGNVQSFTDEFGARLAKPPEADDETHNPVGFHPSKIQSTEYTAFPRDVTRTNADDEEEPVSALDAQEWTTDASSTAGSITVADAEEALSIATSSQTSGDVASATFSNFTIDSGEARKVIQLVLDVNTLEADAVVDVKVVDAGGASVVSTIDPAADSAAAATIATAQGQGIVYQTEVGALTGGPDLDTIEEIAVEISEANADLTIHGLNLELDTEWSFGEREVYDTEEEAVVTETLVEPTGMSWITSLSSLTEQFGSALINALEYKAQIRADESPASNWEAEVETIERGSYSHRFRMAGGIELPGGLYDVDVVAPGTLVGEVRHPESVYQTVEFAHGLSSLPTLDDLEDVEWTDATSTFQDAEMEAEVTISQNATAGDTIGFHAVVTESEEIVNEMVASASGGGGAAVLSSGNSGGFMSNPIGWVVAVFTGVIGTVAMWASRATGE